MFDDIPNVLHMRHRRQLFDKRCAISYRIAGENVDYKLCLENLRRSAGQIEELP